MKAYAKYAELEPNARLILRVKISKEYLPIVKCLHVIAPPSLVPWGGTGGCNVNPAPLAFTRRSRTREKCAKIYIFKIACLS